MNFFLFLSQIIASVVIVFVLFSSSQLVLLSVTISTDFLSLVDDDFSHNKLLYLAVTHIDRLPPTFCGVIV